MEFTRLRAWQESDAADVVHAINNKEVLNNLRDGIPYPYSLADAESFIRSRLDVDKNEAFAWAITDNGRVIGSIGIFRKGNIHRLTAEMGYYLAEDFWGKGIATEAVREAVSYVFLHTDIVRVYAEPFARNLASCRVLEKAGFTFEGVLRKNAIKNGEILDMRLYSIVR
ncbi:MAG TPA: GNAT family N-acetyltransferase [Clostridia bacterium]|nr:GNAT family N-acetyltransferase [Clostridia bacterium]